QGRGQQWKSNSKSSQGAATGWHLNHTCRGRWDQLDVAQLQSANKSLLLQCVAATACGISVPAFVQQIIRVAARLPWSRVPYCWPSITRPVKSVGKGRPAKALLAQAF